ncbi:DUF2126 domain-containing protein [Nitrincola alkalilacustris]|uniref:transglutaminase family protein n=1 Tax=Nitrincola alkalilacustris TaxID=1571224 RepID=UPI00124ED2FF|nr:transglutaminase family protein [Nitrincola alkalilacustris]
MTIRVALKHSTHYDFDRPVSLSPHLVRLKPAPHCRTHIEAYSMKVSGGKYFINWQQDPFGNHLARLVFPEKMQHLHIDVELIAPATVINPFDFFLEDYAQHFPFSYPESLKKELAPYLEVTEKGPLMQAWVDAVSLQEMATVDFLVGLNQRLEQDVNYLLRMEPGVQSAEETLELQQGSCRDSAWLLVQILRHLGLASRFVSGYMVQLTPDTIALDGAPGPEKDFTDLHAWTEVFIPGAGWIGLDPTSGLMAGEGHIPLAATPSPTSAAPISGTTEPCKVTFDVSMTLTRFQEAPRVTKPYTDHQWQAIDALGEQVEVALTKQDLRLTMGGEPTFVAIDDMDAPEWTTAAFGPTKLQRAETLLKRMRQRFASHSLVHFQQGKWYPGEPLPRWALACYWRKDKVPLWQDDRWLADIEQSYNLGITEAEQFARALTQGLGIADKRLLPCYEDAYYYLWLERTQSVDLDIRQSDLKADEERARLAKLLERGLDEVAGYALPLARHIRSKRWQSCAWPVRRDYLFLVPGDSPLGLRLPLSSLPTQTADTPHPRSLFETPSELSDIYGEVANRFSHWQTLDSQSGFHHEQPGQCWQEQSLDAQDEAVFHTALCVEPRDGKLFIFLPPVVELEDYIDLVASIEHTAAALQMPVCIEGYAPPADSRLEKFLITPDPGVIEVNIMPGKNWRELVSQTEGVYEDAHLSRLGTEKFMLDGRHTGTGGGNHITLGGATPADSPFLRRPDLLASMITYWQHHPSLSYLFSGLFVGPTSQAPRIDEARHEAIYELEIALQQMPAGEVTEPWIVDRLLRHLLTDITGNTHRAEFCIDKLYSPDSPTGRLGLLELRGFEMPPHPRMSLMQQLLIRALVARFAAAPYSKPLVRWGTALHDRWVLPHFIWEDLVDILQDLRQHGYEFDPEWFTPFFEFRFPAYGEVSYQQTRLELRQAIEPWNVLGEEVSGSGTARYVDSSVERLQVLVSGYNPARHVVTCNGRKVPLTGTGRSNEAVAGVRYRAWQPSSALHPLIPVHAPLAFDLIDTWNNRSLGGCTYHVVHPAGRNYDTFPINANEAEARRLTRFWTEGHSHDTIHVAHEEVSYEYPHTLDLRRPPGMR